MSGVFKCRDVTLSQTWGFGVMESSRTLCTLSKSRFADYFVVCGLDFSSGLEPDNFAGEKLSKAPLDRPYRCRVLAHYPQSVPWNPFDKDAVSMLCLPHGLEFRTQKHCLEPRFHPFVITKQDGSRTYGASYVFYEEARNRKICSAMQTLQAMHVAELSSGRYSARQAGGGLCESNTRSLPRHFKLTASSQATSHRAALSYYDHTKDILYVSKSLALISQYQYVHASHLFLSSLYRCWKEGGRPSLESLVHMLLYEVTVPAPGTSLSFTVYRDKTCLLHTPTPPHSFELPLFDLPLRQMFLLLGVDIVLQLFTCLLLENQILLCSSDYWKLMVVGESLCCLLLPFSWPHVYVPILPSSCRHFLDAPVPFLMGLHTVDSSDSRTAPEANICLVHLDSASLELPDELPVFPNRNEFAFEITQALDSYGLSTPRPHSGKRQVDVMSSSCILSCGGVSTTASTAATTRTRKHSWANDLDDDDRESLTMFGLDDLLSDQALRGGGEDVGVEEGRRQRRVEDFGVSENECDYLTDQKINNTLRQIFINRFVHMFYDYERFIIQPNQTKEQWLSNRESMQNFDKASFLCEQGQTQLPFLSRFLDTQMFATLIDNKILSTWSSKDLNLRVFDSRISSHKKEFDSGRCSYYESCWTVVESERVLEERLRNVDSRVPPARELASRPHVSRHSHHGFPLLDNNLLLNHQLPRRRGGSGRSAECETKVCLESSETERESETRRSRGPTEAAPLRQTRLATLPPNHSTSSASASASALIAQHANWNFVERLLKDCKTRTKRMLVEKLGSEAIDMGHSEATSLVEENTLIASLCDLLERVWSHGLLVKQGKSALWSHLMSYLQLEDKLSTHTDSPDLSGGSESEETSPRSSTRSEMNRSPGDQQLPVMRPLPSTLAYDLRSVQSMTEIKTHFGYARAFVRLSLEKKLLSRHLRTLLSDSHLLKSRYKRQAFLRCEDEKDQFLYHLLTLNAVDYLCFTNTYLTTRIAYRVAVFPSKRTSSHTSANCWILVSGTNSETGHIPIPRGQLQFLFHHKNLGVLTTVRLGHDNSGLSPKWLVDYLLIRNQVTGHTYSFECGRWLGRGIDDDSTERLLVGRIQDDAEEEGSVQRNVQRSNRHHHQRRSPSLPPPTRPLPLPDIHHMLGNCINSLVKALYTKNVGWTAGAQQGDPAVTLLLCGENGLVNCLQHAFLHGFKSSRLFGRNLYLWHYLVKVREEREYAEDGDEVDRYYCNLIDAITSSTQTLGKDGKFQVFICLTIRDHMLHHVVEGPLSRSKVAAEMYEENSFVRDPSLVSYLFQLFESLDDYHIPIENSLSHGIAA